MITILKISVLLFVVVVLVFVNLFINRKRKRTVEAIASFICPTVNGCESCNYFRMSWENSLDLYLIITIVLNFLGWPIFLLLLCHFFFPDILFNVPK